jgi:hypothetical protein
MTSLVGLLMHASVISSSVVGQEKDPGENSRDFYRVRKNKFVRPLKHRGRSGRKYLAIFTYCRSETVIYRNFTWTVRVSNPVIKTRETREVAGLIPSTQLPPQKSVNQDCTVYWYAKEFLERQHLIVDAAITPISIFDISVSTTA